jgi:protein-tyrosine phosphatase
MNFLMVCLGNICRSPLAEGILQKKAIEQNLHWKVDSAGMGSWHVGHLPDIRSIRVAESNGIDLRGQRGRQFSYADFARFDRIYAMDADNYQDILEKTRTEEDRSKVALILNELWPGENRSVPDPYYGRPADFEQVFQMLDAACDQIVQRYK